MKLSPTKFNNFLNSIGQNSLLYKASICPCRDSRSGSAKQDCLQCYGKGYSHNESPISGVLAFSGMSIQKSWQGFGRYELGDLVITIGSDSTLYNINPYDRVLLTDSTIPFSYLRFHSNLDTLPYSGSVTIEKVYWLNNSQEEVESEIELDSDNNIEWMNNEPNMNTQFSITGRRHPEYYMYMDYPKDRHHFFGLDLPRNVILRVWDL